MTGLILTWGTMTGNPYSNQHGNTRLFSIDDQAMRAVSKQRLAVELIEQALVGIRIGV